MFCNKCGNEVMNGTVFCPRCGNQLTGVAVVADSGFGTLIPKNALALWAYYLGIFSLLCGVLAIPAFVTGILGVRYASQHPEAKGAVHAWIGIIAGIIWFICAAIFVTYWVMEEM